MSLRDVINGKIYCNKTSWVTEEQCIRRGTCGGCPYLSSKQPNTGVKE